MAHRNYAEPLAVPRLTVVSVTYNSADILPPFLDSLKIALANIPNYEVVFADNASADATMAILREHKLRPTIIDMGRNAGYAAGVNAGADLCPPDAPLLVLNPDMTLTPGCIAPLLAALADARVGIAAPRIVDEAGALHHTVHREPSLLTALSDAVLGGRFASRLGIGELVADPRLYQTGGTVDWASGAALAISPRARERAGAWDETFFLYSEEVEYQRRVRQQGLQIAIVPQSTMMHIGGDYLSSPRLSALMTANRIRDYQSRNNAISTLFYRAAVFVNAVLRSGRSAGFRASARQALRPWSPPPETLNPQRIRPKILHRNIVSHPQV